jgi:hypothetical protein
MKIKIYKLKSFYKWARSEKLKDEKLKTALEEIEDGLIDADLGNGLIKKRIAREGEGKRGGHRCILAFKQKDKAIFLFGFSKNEQDNITEKQLESLKYLAKEYLKLDSKGLDKLVKIGFLIEVK